MMRAILFAAVMCLAAAAHAEAPRFAFGVNGEDFSLSTYRVMDDGRLRHLGHRPIDKAASEIILDPSGRFVLSVSNTTDNVMVFRLNPATGELAPVPGSPFATGTRSPFSISFHPSGRFFYLAVRFGGVGAFAFDPETGAVKPVPGSPFPAQRHTRAVAVHPSGKFVYVANAYANTVSAFAINEQNGVLSELPGSPYAVGEFGGVDYTSLGMADVPNEAGGIPHAITLDPQGRFVFVANKAGASISVFVVDASSGRLKAVQGSPFFTGFTPYRLRVHPSGRFLFVTLWSTGKLAVHSIEQNTGRLSEIKGSPFAVDSDAPVDIAFNAAGDQAYVSNYDGNDITLFDVDVHSGTATLKETVTTRSGPWSLVLSEANVPAPKTATPMFAALGKAGVGRYDVTQSSLISKGTASSGGEAIAVATAPSGRFVYALNGPQATLAALRVDPNNGNLSLVTGGSVPTGTQPTDIAIDTNGWYLYVTNAGGNNVSVYYLNPESGIPEAVRGSPFAAGAAPVAVMLDSAARYAMALNSESENISVYRYVNSVSPLIFEGRKYGSPFAAGKEPVALTIEPTGRYAYVANAGSNDISAYHIHRKTGALTIIPGAPFKTGQRPVAIAAHPNGLWLFAANRDPADLRVYRIETEHGALVPQGQTLRLPAQPKAMWLNPNGTTLYVIADDGRRLLSYTADAEAGSLKLQQDERLAQPIVDMTFGGL